MKFETEQELFNHIVAHAASMPGPSVNQESGCVYRSPTGNKCLVGACISDEDYCLEMEISGGVGGLIRFGLLPSGLEKYRSLLYYCQVAHDNLAKLYLAHQDKNRFSAELLEKLRTVAKDFNLDFVLPNEGDK